RVAPTPCRCCSSCGVWSLAPSRYCRASDMANRTLATRRRGPVHDAERSMKTFKNFIGGDWVPPAGGEYFENTNPAKTDDRIGRFPLSGAADVERAVASAQRGFEIWRATPAPARGDVLRRIGDLLAGRKEEIAALMTREMGKPLTETRGDV